MRAGGRVKRANRAKTECISLEEAENNSFTWEFSISWIFLLLRLHHKRMIEMITWGMSFIWQSWGTWSWLWYQLQRCEGLNLSAGQWRVFFCHKGRLQWDIFSCLPFIDICMSVTHKSICECSPPPFPPYHSLYSHLFYQHVTFLTCVTQLKLQHSLCFSPQLPSSRFCFVSWQHLNHCDVTGDQLTCPRVREGNLLWYSDISAVAGCA